MSSIQKQSISEKSVETVRSNVIECVDHDFVLNPNPFSTVLIYCFRLPDNAHVQIDMCTDRGLLIWTLVDENMQAGVYEMKFTEPSKIDAGHYVIKFLVDGKLAGTKELSILK